MVEVVIRFNSKRMVNDINKVVSQEKTELVTDLYDTIRRRSPVRSGKFKRSWNKSVTTNRANIRNPQPYSQRLEEGYSRQAPLGVVKPAIEEVIKRRQTIRRK